MVLETMLTERSDFARPRFVLTRRGPQTSCDATADISDADSEKSLPVVHTRLPWWAVKMYVHGATVR
jgi:hypothetical protein